MAFYLSQGVTYAYRVQGKGPALLLLHGFTGSGQSWTAIAQELADQFTIITIDLIGHGKTDHPADSDRYRMEAAAADIVQILKELAVGPVHLLGYSMGGRLALYLALHFPERFTSLILESASPGLATEAERNERQMRDEALAERIEAEGIEKFVAFWESIPLWDSQADLPEEQKTRLRKIRLANHTLGLANSLRGMGTGHQPSLWSDLDKLNISTLLLTGELDSKFTNIAIKMGQSLSNCRHTTLPNCGHTVHLEFPDAYCLTIIDFLNNLSD